MPIASSLVSRDYISRRETLSHVMIHPLNSSKCCLDMLLTPLTHSDMLLHQCNTKSNSIIIKNVKNDVITVDTIRSQRDKLKQPYDYQNPKPKRQAYLYSKIADDRDRISEENGTKITRFGRRTTKPSRSPPFLMFPSSVTFSPFL